MLLDAGHKSWALATAVAAAAALGGWYALDRLTPGGLTGGSTAGLWFGIGGSALMVHAGLLSALRKVQSWWWLGPRKLWLKGHIWLGLLSVVLILCHSSFRFGGLLEQALMVVFILVIVTGIYGLLLQQFLPRLITARVPCEAPYEQIPHLCRMMGRRANDVLREVWAQDANAPEGSILLSQMGHGAKMQLQKFYDVHVRTFLSETYQPAAPLADPLRAEALFASLYALPGLATHKERVAQMERLCEERRLLAEQERLHHWLHGWLLVHIPLSVALLVLGVAHVVSALYY
jgi:hypothetical protein